MGAVRRVREEHQLTSACALHEVKASPDAARATLPQPMDAMAIRMMPIDVNDIVKRFKEIPFSVKCLWICLIRYILRPAAQ